MNSFDLLMAMTDVDHSHILSAQKQLGFMPNADGLSIIKKRPSFRKALVLAAAIIAILSLTITTAFAVSSEFREMVFRFLRIEKPEIIPASTISTELSIEDMFVEETVFIEADPTSDPIGTYATRVIQGKYVHTPVSTHARDGVFLVCTDGTEMRQGSRYDAYYEANGEFVKLEEHSFDQTYVIHGTEIHVRFDWVEHNGNVHMTWVDPNVQFRTYNEAGPANAVLFRFDLLWRTQSGANTSGSYPVLLNLHTGELTDLLSGTDAEWMPNIDCAAISPDHTKLLLGQITEDGYRLHYADLLSKQVYDIDTLSGEHADACSLMDGKLACWSEADGACKAWNIDLVTLERQEVFAGIRSAQNNTKHPVGIVFIEGFDGSSHWGNMFLGCRFALEVDETQAVYVIDLATGNKFHIEGLAWRDKVSCTPSTDGKKLLMAGSREGQQDIEYVAVLDYDTQSFISFSRDNLNGTKERLAYWFDSNTVIICSEVYASSLCTDYYLYRLTDDTQ